MSDWSDYFEDFPEENPANYVGSKFDPEGAKQARELDTKAEIAREPLNNYPFKKIFTVKDNFSKFPQ